MSSLLPLYDLSYHEENPPQNPGGFMRGWEGRYADEAVTDLWPGLYLLKSLPGCPPQRINKGLATKMEE